MYHLNDNLSSASRKAIHFFIGHIRDDGVLDVDTKDLCAYYKLPMMLISSGKDQEADRLLTYIKAHYMQPNGDFMTSPDTKSAKPEYSEFWGYTNGWIARAAQASNREDISKPASSYLSEYQHPTNGGCFTHHVDSKSNDMTTDMLMTAHIGLLHLEGKRLEIAIPAGDYLCSMLDKQPNIKDQLFLRLDSQNNAITKFPQEMTPFMVIEKEQPNQLYFMVGYPIAYLALLYEQTNDIKYLNYAKQYADFALSCDQTVMSSNFSHKLAWALSLLYKHSPDENYYKAIDSIVQHFISSQGEEGIWYYTDDLNTAMDQSAEITGWLIEISKNLGISASASPFFNIESGKKDHEYSANANSCL